MFEVEEWLGVVDTVTLLSVDPNEDVPYAAT